MTTSLVAVQLLNGVEYGLLLFLVASGLTIIFGVLGVLNFAHGSFYMLGAYLAYFIAERTGSLLFAALLGLPVMATNGMSVSLNIDNIMDTNPSFSPTSANGYANGNPIGRLVTIGLKKKF